MRSSFQHPEHNEPRQKKSKYVRTATIKLSAMISLRYCTVFPVGSVLCHVHRQKEDQDIIENQQDNISLVEVDTTNDPDYQPEEIILSEDAASSSNVAKEELASTLDISPIKFNLKRKSVNEISESTFRYFKRKYKEGKDSLKLKFAEALAPSQSKEFISTIL